MRVGLTLVLVATLVAVTAHAEWPSFHSDERNTGFQSGSAYQAYEDVWWNLKVPSTQIDSSPVVKDGVVLIGAWDKKVRALDAESGSTKWEATMKGPIYSTPAIVSGRVFILDSTGVLEARDLQKGTVLATAAVGATRGSITVHEGKIFVGNDAGEMKAFHTESLLPLWTFKVTNYAEATVTTTTGSGTTATSKTTCGTKFVANSAQIRGAPVVYGGLVLFGSVNHWVFAVKEQGNSDQTTDLQWLFETNDALFGSPSIDASNGRILVGSYDEKVYSIPVAGGGQILVDGKPCTAAKQTAAWTFNVPSDIGQSKVESTAALDGTNAYFGANNGHVYAVKLSDGTKVWDFTTGGPVKSSPAVSNNLVVVGSDDGKVYWLRANNGTEAKSFPADAPIKSSPAIDGNRTFVASFEGSVYMFGPKIPGRPDLRVTNIAYLDGKVTVTVRNAGNADAAASTMRLTIDGALAGDLAVPAIAAGGSVDIMHTQTLAKGPHPIVAQVDQANVVKESEESNNGKTQVIDVAEAKGGGGGGFKIPGVGAPLALLALTMVALSRRRR